MTDRARIRFLTGALAAVLLPGLTGCAGPYYDSPPPPYPPYYYDYYYYPHVDVYFHVYSGHYWYRDGPYWRRAPRLPPHIHLHPRYRVPLRIADEYPYRHYDEHRRKYPPPSRPDAAVPPRARPQTEAGPAYLEREWQDRDREERQYNIQRSEEYRRKPWVFPK